MEEEIGRLKKSETVDIVVKKSDYGGKLGIDIREYITSTSFTGYGKSGTRIPVDKWDEFLKIIQKVSIK